MISCPYCGMSYDGDEHDNCPHCYAPRPHGERVVEKQGTAPTGELPSPIQTMLLGNNEVRRRINELEEQLTEFCTQHAEEPDEDWFAFDEEFVEAMMEHEECESVPWHHRSPLIKWIAAVSAGLILAGLCVLGMRLELDDLTGFLVLVGLLLTLGFMCAIAVLGLDDDC